MVAKLRVAVVMIAFDRRILDRAVHPLELSVRPGVSRLGQAMVDIVAGTSKLEAVSSEGLAGRNRLLDDGGGRGDVAGRGEVGAVVGEHRVHPVGHGLDEMPEEIARDPPRRSSMELDEGELGRAVDGDEQVEPPFRRVNLGQIDVEVAERVSLEARPLGFVAADLRQSADAVALQAAVQRRAGQVRDRGLQRVKAVVERQERVATKGDHDRLIFR